MGDQNVKKLTSSQAIHLAIWYNTHLGHTFPENSEKLQLVHETGASKAQVENFLINARRRHPKGIYMRNNKNIIYSEKEIKIKEEAVLPIHCDITMTSNDTLIDIWSTNNEIVDIRDTQLQVCDSKEMEVAETLINLSKSEDNTPTTTKLLAICETTSRYKNGFTPTIENENTVALKNLKWMKEIVQWKIGLTKLKLATYM